MDAATALSIYMHQLLTDNPHLRTMVAEIRKRKHGDTCAALEGAQSRRRAGGLATSEARATSASDAQPIRGHLPAANTIGDTCGPRMRAQSRRRAAASKPRTKQRLPAATTPAEVTR